MDYRFNKWVNKLSMCTMKPHKFLKGLDSVVPIL
jgi:hypothetical protein